MKLLIILALVAVVAARPEDDYNRYENFDVEELAENERLLLAYVKCFLGTGSCTSEGKDFKKFIPEAIQSNCGKCSEKQKSLISRVMKAIIEKLPEKWTELKKIHDPEDQYDAQLQEFLKTYGK